MWQYVTYWIINTGIQSNQSRKYKITKKITFQNNDQYLFCIFRITTTQSCWDFTNLFRRVLLLKTNKQNQIFLWSFVFYWRCKIWILRVFSIGINCISFMLYGKCSNHYVQFPFSPFSHNISILSTISSQLRIIIK